MRRIAAVIAVGVCAHTARAESPMLSLPAPEMTVMPVQAAEPLPSPSQPPVAPAAPPKILSVSEQNLYTEALFNYTNIAYMMHRDVQREALVFQGHVSSFVSRPGDALYAQVRLSAARLYGAFLRTLYVYLDDEPYRGIRRRLLPPDTANIAFGAPYHVLLQEAYTGAVPPAPTIEEIAARRAVQPATPAIDGDTDDAIEGISVYEGFGALRALLRLPAEMYVGYTPAPQARRALLQLITRMIGDDTRVLPGAYRPGDKNTASRLLTLPPEQAWRHVTGYMAKASQQIASGYRIYTPDAVRYGDVTNVLSGVRVFVTGSYRHMNGPGLAALALSVGADRAGFLNFSFSRVAGITSVRDTPAARDEWRALAESLSLFK